VTEITLLHAAVTDFKGNRCALPRRRSFFSSIIFVVLSSIFEAAQHDTNWVKISSNRCAPDARLLFTLIRITWLSNSLQQSSTSPQYAEELYLSHQTDVIAAFHMLIELLSITPFDYNILAKFVELAVGINATRKHRSYKFILSLTLQ